MIYLNKKTVVHVLFLFVAVIDFVLSAVVRENIFTALEQLPRPQQIKTTTTATTKNPAKKKRKRFRTSGRLIGRPNPIKCSRRPKQLVDDKNGHYYFLSEDSNFKVCCLLAHW